jgi:beta-glucosidase
MTTAALCVALLAGWTASAQAATAPCPDEDAHPWCDRSAGPDTRAGRLVRAMTLTEKIKVLAGSDLNGHTGSTASVPRLGVPQSYNTDGPVGVRQGKATALPTPMAEAATWDPAMARLHGEVIGDEARAKGNDGVLAPTVNIMRTPMGGRTFEGFGEDPFLVGRIAVGWIQGAQSQGVFATVKHFAVNNQEGADPTGQLSSARIPIGLGIDNMRYIQNSVVDERTLREVYLPQFEAAVKEGKVGSVMCSYNRFDGDWACANRHLLQDILIGEWGFKGTVMSDWIFATHPWDTAKSLNNGLDLEMPTADSYLPLLVQAALAGGATKERVIDQHVRRIFRMLFDFGFFDRPAYRNDDSQIDRAAHGAASQRISESSITLLKNRDGILPLDPKALRSVAVVGAYATKFVTGGGSGNVTPPSTISALQGIRDRLGPGVDVRYDDGSDPARAAAVAKAADAAIVVVGDYQTEGADKSCLTLECPDVAGDQDGLVAAVAAAQPRNVVVLETGGPVLTPWRDAVGGLLEAWYPGDHGGAAIARVLFGDTDPGGRLPATFPRSADQEQVAGDREKYPGTLTQDVFYKEGILTGYRWFDAKGLDPAFEFGAGLSYTTFRFDRPTVSATPDGATLKVNVVNTGKRPGAAVPQLYVAAPQTAEVEQPPLKLIGFGKRTIAAGARHRFTIPVTMRALSHWDVDAQDWAVTPGCYGLALGTSSRQILHRVTVAAGGARCAGAVASVPGAAQPRRVCRYKRKVVVLKVHGRKKRVVRRVKVCRKAT